ncbi:MAG: serine/threonine-protein kinase [Methylococcales bacterium]|nr:serine/threonine-protein kinase [Methylococcales bacterium]
MSEKPPAPNDNDATLINTGEPDSGSALNSRLRDISSQRESVFEQTTHVTRSYTDTGSIAGVELGIGSIIKDTFELVALLGEGGMGTVFKALNKVWEEVEARDPYVAIKVLKPELSENKQLVRSLYSDFDRTKMLSNCPNIIKVHGFDRDGPIVYMTMEYLTGKTLGDYLKGTPMSLAQAWFIIEGIGNALAYAHENNIVHRDIKPGNVFITDDGLVKVLDFGIASKINENKGDETKFGGHELGALTVAYASPEMQRDYPPDARDDIYAFGCVIYEILTGKQFYRQKIHKAAPIKGLNHRQMEALNEALAFERDQRTGSINELLDKLRPVKTPWLKYLGIGGCLLIIAGLALFWRANEPISPPEIDQPQPSAVTQLSPQTPISAPVFGQGQTQAPITSPVPVQKVVPAEEPTAPAQKPAQISSEPDYSSTSSDGVAHIETSKPEYKNGESFQLSFRLTQPMYVRITDRDAKGIVTILRPNPRQPDQLLPANKELVFPPKGIKVPVKGLPGSSTVTIIASAQRFPKAVELLNNDGSVSEQVQSGPYSWTQARYTLY